MYVDHVNLLTKLEMDSDRDFNCERWHILTTTSYLGGTFLLVEIFVHAGIIVINEIGANKIHHIDKEWLGTH